MYIPQKIKGIPLPKDIWRIIFYEFNPSPLHEYLQTTLNNYYAISFRRCIYPSCKYRVILKRANTFALMMFLNRLRRCYQPQKRYKSKQYLNAINYEDFPVIEKIIRNDVFLFKL